MKRERLSKPVHRERLRKQPDLKVGMIVSDVGAPGRTGRIIRLGSEVSEVRWKDSIRAFEQYVTNQYLRPVTEGNHDS